MLGEALSLFIRFWLTITRTASGDGRPPCSHAVAPHAGAWIETPCGCQRWQSHSVAPHRGAWIETISGRVGDTSAISF